MSEVERPSAAHHLTHDIQPRHPDREIAELLAAAIVRMRSQHHPNLQIEHSEVGLGFSADQRVNANPSYTEGVQK